VYAGADEHACGARACVHPAGSQGRRGERRGGGGASEGFTPNNTSDYHPNQALRVLIGTRTGSGDGYGQLAFFFVNGSYIGTDSSQPSATLRVVGQSDTEVTLAYPLYRRTIPCAVPAAARRRCTSSSTTAS